MKNLQRVRRLSIMGLASAFQIAPLLTLNHITRTNYPPYAKFVGWYGTFKILLSNCVSPRLSAIEKSLTI